MRDRWITDREPSARFPVYTRSNAGEVMPDPSSPLNWTFVWESGCVLGWRDGFVSIGVLRDDEMPPERPPICGSFGGYLYNGLTITRMLGVRMPGASVEMIDHAYFGEAADIPPYVAHPDDECPSCTQLLGEHLAWAMSTDGYPLLLELKEAAEEARRSRPDLTSLADAELVERARSFQPLMRRMWESHVWAGLLSSVGPGALAAICGALGRPDDAIRLVAGIGDVDSAVPSLALWDLSRLVAGSPELRAALDAGVDGVLDRLRAAPGDDARSFVEAFDRFLVDHGSRGTNEWDIRSESWETRPVLALAALDRMRHVPDADSPAVRFEARRADREALGAELRGLLAGDPEAAGTFDAALRSAALFLAGRERAKTNVVRVIHEVRMCFLELGRRMVEQGVFDRVDQVFLLLEEELPAFLADPAPFRERLAEREREYRELFDLEPPFIVDGVVPPLTSWARRGGGEVAAPLGPGGELRGQAGCPGQVTGRARVVLDPADPRGLEPGEVLVAPHTDPAWTPLFVTAAAVVVDVGALASHAVIVSRELGLPCVVSAPDASRRIPDGALVAVDGTTGVVRVLELA